MSEVPSPLVSELQTPEQAASDAAWLRAQVQVSLDDPRPGIPLDKVMAEMEAILTDAEGHHSNKRRLRALVSEGLASGPATPMTSADWLNMEAVARGEIRP